MSLPLAASATPNQAASATVADLTSMIKPFTPDALANGFATLIGALIGAMLAYLLQRHFQKVNRPGIRGG